MKNFLKTFGIIAIAAIIGFSMTACPEEDDGGPVNFGDKLEIKNEQVYTVKYSETAAPVYTKFTGDVALVSNEARGESGEIKGGKLTYTIGAPPTRYLNGFTYMKGDLENLGYTNVGVTNTDVKFYQLEEIEAVSGNRSVYKGENSYKLSGTTYSGSSESVMFIYVDKAVTLTAKGGTFDEDGSKITLKDLNLSLKQGWNALYTKESGSFNINTYTGSSTVSVSIDNPNLNWVLEEDR